MNKLPDSDRFQQPRRSGVRARVRRVLFAAAAFSIGAARAEPDTIKNLDIFVDPPSAFVFVKMPQGWKFVGKLDEQALRELPTGVHTSLLRADVDQADGTEPDERAGVPAAITTR